jgi:predicted membrane-bound spermidine synthase
MVLISLPLTGVLQFALFEEGLAFSLHLVVPPLAFVVGAAFFELVSAVAVLQVAFLLPHVLAPHFFVVNFVNSVQLIAVLLFASHSFTQFTVVSAGNRHVRVI